jgi:hypothetical protein
LLGEVALLTVTIENVPKNYTTLEQAKYVSIGAGKKPTGNTKYPSTTPGKEKKKVYKVEK